MPPQKRTHQSAPAIRELLKPPNTSITALLQARATPNQRLVEAFGITSAFVSSDPKVHKDFSSQAKRLITSSGSKSHGWQELAQVAEAAVLKWLPEQNLDYPIFIQCLTFVIVLVGLFKADPESLRQQDIIFVTNIINKRWTDSKSKDALTMRQDDSLRKITECIDQWVTDRDQYPNPLNLILPAYETMWRLVAVTVAYIYRCCDNTLHDTAIAFGQNPTEAQFRAFANGGQAPSMESIILEALRLHPPTRRIARASELPWWQKLLGVPSIEIADIEAVHLSDAYGENPSEFNPMRFHPSRAHQQPELFAFGHGKLSCIAAPWAPMAAAVIVAKVVQQMEESGSSLTVGERIGGRSGWDGWSVAKERE
ncbi:hypothetical protein HYDPIDRAFT_31217 [Hydnomerulius pinastri MD-312]|uniref:Cytochrome P450 n=1 Tax=Hydnomerulius pinastri MD-312 TaxID=994086 RepID=A0A0C9VUD1_9AGAM|nr:hypothetical protein HYDPIDRAFT_31217 [Hydnomerulius pinastri MD-312]